MTPAAPNPPYARPRDGRRTEPHPMTSRADIITGIAGGRAAGKSYTTHADPGQLRRTKHRGRLVVVDPKAALLSGSEPSR